MELTQQATGVCKPNQLSLILQDKYRLTQWASLPLGTTVPEKFK